MLFSLFLDTFLFGCYKLLFFLFVFLFFFLFFFFFCVSVFGDFRIHPFFSVFWFSMVCSSEVRIACPLISFFFMRLRGYLGIFPYLDNFVFEGSSLSVALAELLPLPRQSIDWFEDLVRERGRMSEVRLSELETGLSSSDKPVEVRFVFSLSSLIPLFIVLCS